MSYYLFGPSADSWALGNKTWNAYFQLSAKTFGGPRISLHSILRLDGVNTTLSNERLIYGSQNLPTSFSKFFESQTLTANTLKWFSTGPNGLCCFLKTDDTFIQSQDPNLLADTSPSNLYGIRINQVEQLSFSPEGGWFVRYNDGTVRLSMIGSFHKNFHTLASEYMQTRGPSAHNKQASQLKWVFFGADGAVIILLANGTIRWLGITEDLAANIRSQAALGWSLGIQTTLCHWDKTYYYMKWTKNYGLETSSSWNVNPTGIVTALLLREVAEGGVPVSYTATPSPAPAAPRPAPAKEPETWVIMPRESPRGSDQISLGKWEQLTGVRRVTDEVYHGRNETGSSGRFPRQNVTMWRELVGVQYNCEGCSQIIQGAFYHCAICSNDDFDLCRRCSIGPKWAGKCCFDSRHTVTLRVQVLSKTGQSVVTICEDKDWTQSAKYGLFEWIDHTILDPPSVLDFSSLNITSSSQPPSLPPRHSSSSSKPEKESDYDKELSGSLDGAIVEESPNVHWDDIAGLSNAKEELHEAITLPIRYPQLFTGKRKAKKGILLFGPPGTGKSYLAKACATEIKCTFFSISCSDIISKWQGESERQVKNLFKKARKHNPSIIFIDEIDAMGGNRDEAGGGGGADLMGMKTEFLVQMDGVGNDTNGILVLAATNLPWKLDPALRRRFQRRIHIGLPDAKARASLFEIGIGDTPNTLKPDDFEMLGEITEGFSGSDVSGVTQDALMVPVKKITKARHFKKVFRNHKEMLTPCEPYDLGAMPMRLSQVPPEKLLEPPLSSEDFLGVIAKTRPSVATDELGKYTKWTEDFGSEGA